MPAKNPNSNRQQDSRSAPGARDSAAAAPAIMQAAQEWTALVDDWWRQQSAVLPPQLEQAMSAALDQSKALVEMAFSQAAGADTESAAIPETAGVKRPEGTAASDELCLWQPVIDACRACEASLLGASAESDPPQSGSARDYQRAARAYLNEFGEMNGEVAYRLRQRLAASPPGDFRQLHALVVEETEAAYLDRVSTDRFAALQAAFINAMFRLRKAMADAGTTEKP